MGKLVRRERGHTHKVRLTPWVLEPFVVGVLRAAAAIRKLLHTILTLVSQRFEPGGRPHNKNNTRHDKNNTTKNDHIGERQWFKGGETTCWG